FVDPWSLCLQDYCNWMKTYDRHNFRNCAVMVPWNDADPDTPAVRAELQKKLDEAFEFRMNSKSKVYFRYPIRNVKDFRTKLKITLAQLRGSVTASATAQKPVDGRAMVESASQRGSSITSISIVDGPGST